MDKQAEVSAFLKTRRDRITPEQAGLSSIGQRRVPGLRRGEVAQLAGMSVEYYIRLERGNLSGVSDSVLDALAGALRLDDTERDHLYALARAADTGPAHARRRPAKKQTVRPSVLRIVEGLHDQPAYVRNNRLDILAANPLARALHHQVFEYESPNTCRFVFLDPRAPSLYLDWARVARNGVGVLRVEAARHPYDRELGSLIVSCPCAATPSAPCGASRTCTPTPRAPSGSCTLRSVSWPSSTKRWTCPATTDCPSPSTAPNPAPRPPMP